MEIKIEFTYQKNYRNYALDIGDWLEDDWKEKGKPDEHFYHNRSEIASALRQGKGIVAVKEKNNEKKAIGVMIWTDFTEEDFFIDIVIVKENYRNKGVFNKMLLALCKEYTDIEKISLRPTKKSLSYFKKSGWHKDPEESDRYFKEAEEIKNNRNEKLNLSHNQENIIATKSPVKRKLEFLDTEQETTKEISKDDQPVTKKQKIQHTSNTNQFFKTSEDNCSNDEDKSISNNSEKPNFKPQ